MSLTRPSTPLLPLWVGVGLVLGGCSAAEPMTEDEPTTAARPTSTAGQVAAAQAVAGALRGGEPVVAFEYDGRVQVAALDAAEGVPLAPGIQAGDQDHPAWSPDGTRVAFSAVDFDMTRDIWVSTLDGTATKVFDCIAPCAYADEPSWHPNGGSLLFEQATELPGDSGRYDLTAFDLASTTSTTVFSQTGSEGPYGGHWSPDGTRVVAELRRYPSASVTENDVLATRVVVIDPATGSTTELAGGAAGAWEPDWSPDGQRVVFTSTSQDWELFTVPASGGAATRLTHRNEAGGRAGQASFSQDGSTIVADVEEAPGVEHARAGLVDPTTGEVGVVSSFSATHPHLRPAS